MHTGRNECSQPLESSFSFSLVLAQSSLRQGERDREGAERNQVPLVVRGSGGRRTVKVQSTGPRAVRGPGLLCVSPTPPPTAQAKTMGACARSPGCSGQGRAPAGSPPAVPATAPSPGPCVPGSPTFLEQPLPKGISSGPNLGPEPSSARGAGIGGSHHGAPPVALDGEIWAEEQISDGQEQGLGQGPRVLVIVLSLLGTQRL